MKRVIHKYDSLNQYKEAGEGIHSIHSEDMQYIIDNYVVPELKKHYGQDNVIVNTGENITVSTEDNYLIDIKIEEIPEPIAQYEIILTIDGKTREIYPTNSSESLSSYIVNEVDRYYNEHTDDFGNWKNNSIESAKKSNKISITAATQDGTKFYKISKDELIKILKDADANIWMITAFEQDGLDAIDYKHNLYGSYLDSSNDILYICVSDGMEIEVDGKAVDPETAFDEYSPEDLSNYIENATPEIVLNRITEDEIKPPFFDGWAPDLLASGHTFVELMEAAEEFLPND